MAKIDLLTAHIRHPKISALSNGAYRLWVAGLCYSKEHLTDGKLLEAWLPSLGVKVTPAVVGELTRCVIPGKSPLWEPIEGGYEIHGYLDWQDSADTVKQNREALRERVQRHRQRRYNTEGNDHCNVVTNGVTNSISNDSVQTTDHRPQTPELPSEDRSPDKDTRAQNARARGNGQTPGYEIQAARLELIATWNEATGPPFTAVRNPAGWRDIDAALASCDDMDTWRERFRRVAKSRFLREQAHIAPADFWFVLKHVDELDAGRYDDRDEPADRKKAATRDAIARFVAKGAQS